jgi:hypothetical protein
VSGHRSITVTDETAEHLERVARDAGLSVARVAQVLIEAALAGLEPREVRARIEAEPRRLRQPTIDPKADGKPGGWSYRRHLISLGLCINGASHGQPVRGGRCLRCIARRWGERAAMLVAADLGIQWPLAAPGRSPATARPSASGEVSP